MTASEEAEARTQTVTRTKELIVDILNTKNISSGILLKVYQQLLGIYVEPLIPSNLITDGMHYTGWMLSAIFGTMILA
jgi:hypothetical protein